MNRSCLPNASEKRMLAGLESYVVTTIAKDPLKQLCSLGVGYGWGEVERTIASQLLDRCSAGGQMSVRQYLGRTLEWITGPCFELEWASFKLAAEALGLGSPEREETKKNFLGARPVERLFSLFRKFPVLAELWTSAITQWRDQVEEILARAAADERAVARQFFGASTTGRMTNVQLGLSDRHRNGRTVAFIEFEHGCIIYKPRSAAGEIEWTLLLRWLNEHGFKPRLKEPQILRRKGYHWMEYVEANACPDAAAVGRFYKRLGGMIAAACLLDAVDCHRDNLIAAGEHPVVVDIDALGHVSPRTRTRSWIELLYRTGFFPNSDPVSLQSRSSVLGKAKTGSHLPRIGRRRETAVDYVDEIVSGFEKGWRGLVGTPRRRETFFRRRRRIQGRARRWIYRATESYAAILRASVQPSALISSATRGALIQRIAARHPANPAILRREIAALARLDIPYFLRRTSQTMKPLPASAPPELSEAIRRTLESSGGGSRG